MSKRSENLRRALKFLKHETLSMEDEIDALKRELEKMRVEANRYRWLAEARGKRLDMIENGDVDRPVVFTEAKS